MSVHIIPANTNLIDGAALGIKPGDIIAIDRAKKYSEPFHFTNIHGTPESRVVITTAGGSVIREVGAGFSYAFKFTNCTDWKLSGEIELGGGNKDSIGIACEKGTSDFEIEGMDIHTVGFACIMAKDNGAFLGDFVLQNVKIHHNKCHHSGGEGMYLGNSATRDSKTGKINHELKNVLVYDNEFDNNGWEPIQLGRGVSGCEIFRNRISNYGTKNTQYQNNGIQIGDGSAGLLCYDNIIRKGAGNGIICLGSGVHIYRNTIVDAGENGIYSDDRADTMEGFKFTENVIVNPKTYCIGIHANRGLLNHATSNMLINPGGIKALRGTERNAFLEKDNAVVLKEFNNYQRDEASGFENMTLSSYLSSK